jgi:hypothetical protein
MTLAARLALIAAAALAAAAIAFALPLPAGFQAVQSARPHLATKATPAGACSCAGRDHVAQHV